MALKEAVGIHRLPSMIFLGSQNQSPVCRNTPLGDSCMVHWGFHFKLKAQICVYLLCKDLRSHFLLNKHLYSVLAQAEVVHVDLKVTLSLEIHLIAKENWSFQQQMCVLCVYIHICTYVLILIQARCLLQLIDYSFGLFPSLIHHAWEPCGFGCIWFRTEPIFEYVVIYEIIYDIYEYVEVFYVSISIKRGSSLIYSLLASPVCSW